MIAIACLLAVCASGTSALSAEIIRLKNGSSVQGKKAVMTSLSGPVMDDRDLKKIKDATPDPPSIVRVENDWQFVYFPVRQQEVPDPAKKANFEGVTQVIFKLAPPKKNSGRLTLAELGTLTFVGAFDEFGHRSVKIATALKPLEIFQAITEVAPDHVIIESTNLDWKLGQSLKTIPIATIDSILRRKIKQVDPTNGPNARLQLARFYVQAEFYEHAFRELDAIEKDFPEKKDVVNQQRNQYMNYFGGDILGRLKRRQRAGQHRLVEDYVDVLLKQSLSGSVLQSVQEYHEAYAESRRTIERAKLLLAEWQSKLKNPDHESRLQALRSEVNEQLDYETLPRLDAFLKAEADDQYEPSQRLGLAYSGWVLGAANAIDDLDQAFRVWDARHTVLECLRSDDPAQQNDLVEALGSSENISPDVVQKMVAQLPPIVDPGDTPPGVPHRIETLGNEPARYWVVLPHEYSPNHNYPMVIVLRPRHQSAETTLMYWAGDAGFPDLGNQRGYIVIAPEYAEKNEAEYSYGAAAHKIVLDSLIDARKRFSVDSDRVFLVGHGIGADAAFDIGMAHADEFAGVIPMGGDTENYCKFIWKNAAYTSWLVIGKGEFKGNRDAKNNGIFGQMMKSGFDFMLVEYFGRNGADLFDEIPKCFNWMELVAHVRAAPPKKFHFTSLRNTDNRFFWMTARGLPRNYVLPAATGASPSIKIMEIKPQAFPGNKIVLPGLTDDYILRLSPDLIDFDAKLTVSVGGKDKFHGFVTRDVRAVLDELRSRGDRQRLPLAILNL